MGSDGAAIVRRALDKALEVILAREEELGRLDAVAGDGDHGAGMARGFRAAVAAVNSEAAKADQPGPLIARAGTAFADAAGGASGALVGILITTTGQSLTGDTIDAKAVHQALAAGLAALCKLGKAKAGDKTMVDTLDPFVRSLGEAVEGGAALPAAWQSALAAAEQGARATADLISKRGRASRLGERSRGNLDAGAMSMLYVLQAVGEVLNDSKQSG